MRKDSDQKSENRSIYGYKPFVRGYQPVSGPKTPKAPVGGTGQSKKIELPVDK